MFQPIHIQILTILMSGGHPQSCQEISPNTCKFPYTFPYSTVNYVARFGIVGRPVELSRGYKDVMILLAQDVIHKCMNRGWEKILSPQIFEK